MVVVRVKVTIGVMVSVTVMAVVKVTIGVMVTVGDTSKSVKKWPPAAHRLIFIITRYRGSS